MKFPRFLGDRPILAAGIPILVLLAGAVSIPMNTPPGEAVNRDDRRPTMKSNDDESTRHYVMYLIWIRDREKWGRYGKLVKPVALRYGAVERSLRPEKSFLEGRPLPDLVNVTYSASRETFENLAKDPEFQSVVHLRSESTELLWVAGKAVAGQVSSDNVSGRMYLVEIARFGPEGLAGYRRYESEAEPILRRYGYHVERVLSASDASPELPFRPDLVKIAYFDERDGMTRMEQDPDHARIEALYPAAVQSSIWLFGATPP